MTDPRHLGAAAAALVLGAPLPALAGLQICNGATVTASVAIGYSENDVWTSEGWWNLSPGECATVISGDLPQRFYYWRATSNAGPFADEGYVFCTQPRAFTIPGDSNCAARGYDESGFSQIDTGQALDFTYTIPAAAAPAGAPDRPQTLLDEVRAAIVGRWRNTEDASREVVISADGRIETQWLGVEVVSGNWRVTDSCPLAGGEGPWLVVNYDGDSGPTCWELFGLSRTTLEYAVVGGDRFIMRKQD